MASKQTKSAAVKREKPETKTKTKTLGAGRPKKTSDSSPIKLTHDTRTATDEKLRELAELLVRINGGGSFVVRDFPPDRKKIDIGDYYADFSLITRRLGWVPRTDLPTALARTLAYYRRERPHYL